VFGSALEEYRRPLARISGAIMIVMGLVILGGARLPFLMRERRFHPDRLSFTASETLLVGMAFGFGWTPCFGPILASILVYTSTVETVREGTLLLTAYSLGLGLPFLVVGLGLSRLQRLTRAISRHGGAVIAASGAALIAIGVLFVSGQMFRIAVAGQQLLGATAGLARG
jgi:cytochrome c-type biogenesis protein